MPNFAAHSLTGGALSAEMTTERGGGSAAAITTVAHVVDDCAPRRRSISVPQQLRPEVCGPLCARAKRL